MKCSMGAVVRPGGQSKGCLTQGVSRFLNMTLVDDSEVVNQVNHRIL